MSIVELLQCCALCMTFFYVRFDMLEPAEGVQMSLTRSIARASIVECLMSPGEKKTALFWQLLMTFAERLIPFVLVGRLLGPASQADHHCSS